MAQGRLGQWCDKHHIVPKVLFFLCTCYMYAPALFQTRYIAEVWNIKAEHYGFMNFVTLLSIPAAIFWSGLADRKQAHRNVLVALTIFYALSYCSMWALEPFIANWSTETRVCIIVFLFFLTTQACSVIFPLLGTLVLEILETSPYHQSITYSAKWLLGRQKIFGTIGYGCVSFLNGYLTDYISYKAQFILTFVPALLFCIIALATLPETTQSKHQPSTPDAKPHTSPNKRSLLSSLRALLGKWDFSLLLFLVFVVGFVGATFNTYFSVFMSKVLSNTEKKNLTMGTITLVRTAAELPIGLLGSRVWTVFGPHGILFIAILATALRAFGYAFLIQSADSAKFAYVLELLKGISHMCNNLASSVLASDMAPASSQGLAQALLTSAHHHTGFTFSGLFSSIYLDAHKTSQLPDAQQIGIYQTLFLYTGLLALVGLLLCALRLLYRPKSL